MTRLAAIAFDFDGLIIDTETGAYESTRDIFAEHGVALDREWWQSIIGTADHLHWFDLLQQHVTEPLDRDIVLARREAQKRELLLAEEIQPGVVALLDEAVDAGVPTAVASSSSFDWVGSNLERVGLLDRFGVIVTSDDINRDKSRSKPAPDLYRIVVERLTVEARHAVAIEDSPNGVAAARAAGLACLAVPAGLTAGTDCSAADRVVASLEEVALADLAALVDGH
jgi:HAD superfamily hydrolase (TIGR01509 family)